jgi:hypothetical protein
LIERQFGRRRAGPDQQQTRGWRTRPQDLSQAASETISSHRCADCATDRERHVWRVDLGIGQKGAPERVDPHSMAVAAEPLK